jgi:hypothetical protein
MSDLDWESRAAMGHPDALVFKGKGKDGKVQKGQTPSTPAAGDGQLILGSWSFKGNAKGKSKLTDEQIEEFLECCFFAYHDKAKAAGTWMPYAGTHFEITKKVKDFFFGHGRLTTNELGTVIIPLGHNPKEVGQLTEVQINELKGILLHDLLYKCSFFTVQDLKAVMKTLGGAAPGETMVEMRARKAAEQRLIDEEHGILAQTDKKGEDLVRVLYSIMVAYIVSM